jgi:dTMP kinase
MLRDAGIEPTLTREPGGTPIAERIRGLLLDPDNRGMTADTEVLLLFAARIEHLHRCIRPALAAGRWVVCDRFTDATFAYQGGGRGIDVSRIAVLEDLIPDTLRPDLTLLLDLPAAAGLQRAQGRGGPADRIENEPLAFFERVREAYLQIARREPGRVRHINAALSQAQVTAAVQAVVGRFLMQHGLSTSPQAIG